MPRISDSKYRVDAGWDHVAHLTEEAKRKMLDSTPPYMRDARSKGLPSKGTGAIYPFSASEITTPPFMLPPHYKRGFALDDGWNKTACVWGALDPDTDILYVTTEHYRSEATPEQNALAIRARGAWIPGVGDAAATTRDGQQVIEIYRRAGGLDLMLADKEVEAGIYDVWMRLSTGRLMIFSTCLNLLWEMDRYHRDEKGKIVKRHDHLMDALRYLCRPNSIARMIAKPVPRIIGQGGAAVGNPRMGY